MQRADRPKSPRVVVLTGSTGYLGQSLLHALIGDRRVGTVHCIAVRNPALRVRVAEVKVPTPKVIIHEGDLALPRLGLLEQVARDIFKTADVVIHNGADVSYLKTYASLRAANLQSTKQLAELCLDRLVPLHYVSTANVCTFAAMAGQHQIHPASVAQYQPPRNMGGGHSEASQQSEQHQGYAASKWASEAFLENVSAQHLLWPVYIHRPSHIMRTDDPQLDIVENIRHYSRLLGVTPDLRGKFVQGCFDVVALNMVVSGILGAVLNGELEDGVDNNNYADLEVKGKVIFSHHVGGTKLSLLDIDRWGAGESVQLASEDNKQLSLEDWVDRASQEGMHPTVAVAILALAQQQVFLPKLLKE